MFLYLCGVKQKQCSMKKYKVHEVIDLLKVDGWFLGRQNGSHRQLKHPAKKGTVTVNGKPSEVLSQFILNSILEAGRVEITTLAKNLITMEKNKIIVHIDWEDNYCAGLDSLACVATGQTLLEVKQRIEETLEWHLDSMRKDKEEIPAEFESNYELSYQLTAQALLKTSQHVITQAALSRATGINQQQLSHYSTGTRRPRQAQRERILKGLHELGRELLEVE